MIEREHDPHALAARVANIREQLLRATISAEIFLTEARAIDQSSPDRDGARAVITLLNDPEVAQRCSEHGEYYNLLSLATFHEGQRAALTQSIENALRLWNESLIAAEHLTYPEYENWKLYIRASITYAQQNAPELASIVAKMQDGPNKRIAANLLAGLQQRGTVSYTEDYK